MHQPFRIFFQHFKAEVGETIHGPKCDRQISYLNVIITYMFNLFKGVPDEDIEKSLRSKYLEPSRLVVFKAEGKIKGQYYNYMVNDKTYMYIECRTTSGNGSILELMPVYYVFDMEYPRMYSKLLGILQTHLLCLQPYAGQKSMQYKKFSTALEKELYTVNCEKTSI